VIPFCLSDFKNSTISGSSRPVSKEHGTALEEIPTSLHHVSMTGTRYRHIHNLITVRLPASPSSLPFDFHAICCKNDGAGASSVAHWRQVAKGCSPRQF